MIYRIYKENGRIGTGMEKTDVTFAEIQEVLPVSENQTSLAVFDEATNTIHILNDKVIDVSSIIQKFRNYCDIPDKHQFNIVVTD